MYAFATHFFRGDNARDRSESGVPKEAELPVGLEAVIGLVGQTCLKCVRFLTL